MAAPAAAQPAAAAASNAKEQEFICNIVSELLNVKSDKVAKSVQVDEAAAALKSFISASRNLLAVYHADQGQMAFTNELPSKVEKAWLLFYTSASGVDFSARLQYLVVQPNPCENLLFYFDLIDQAMRARFKLGEIPAIVSNENHSRITAIQTQLLGLSSDIDSEIYMPLPALIRSAFPNHVRNRQLLQMGLAVDDPDSLSDLKYCLLKWQSVVTELYRRTSYPDTEDESDSGSGAEVRYLERRLQNFESAIAQVTSPIMRILLEDMDQKHYDFSDVYVDVLDLLLYGFDETRNILKLLRPVSRFVRTFYDHDIPRIKVLIDPMYQIVDKLLDECKGHFAQSRTLQILQDVGSYLIELIKTKFEASDVFKADTAENLGRVNEWISVWQEQMRCLMQLCGKKPEINQLTFVQKESCPGRMNLAEFSSRLDLVKLLLTKQLDFQRLEKVEIGGRLGRQLSQDVIALFAKFMEESQHFASKQFDPLDLSTNDFAKAAEVFLGILRDMEDRMMNIAWSDLESCLPNTAVTVKHLEMLSLIIYDKPSKPSVELSFFAALRALHSHVKRFEAVVDSSVAFETAPTPEILPYPKLLSALKWAYGVEKFFLETYNRFSAIKVPLSCAKFHKNLITAYQRLSVKVASVRERAKTLVDDLNSRLEQNLLQYSLVTKEPLDKDKLTCNFTSQLEDYLDLAADARSQEEEGATEVVPSSIPVTDQFRDLIFKLQSAVRLFNKIKTFSVGAEKELLGAEFDATQGILLRAETMITWGSPEASSTVNKLYDRVFDLSGRLKKAQRSLYLICKNLEQWQRLALFSTEGQTSLLRLNLPNNIREDRITFMKASGEAIQFLFQTIGYLFHADRQDSVWITYSNFVDHLVLEGLTGAVANNLDFISERLSFNRTTTPFIRVVLSLKGTALVYEPEASDEAKEGSLLGAVMRVVDEVFSIGDYIPRLAVDKGSQTFTVELSNIPALVTMKEEIRGKIKSVNKKLQQYKEDFDKYSAIWVMDRETQMKQFEIKTNLASGLDDAKLELYKIPKMLNVAKIDEQIEKNRTTSLEVEKAPDAELIDTWLKVDFKELKKTIVKHLSTYNEELKNRLYQFFSSSVLEFEKFAKESLQVFALSRSTIDRKTLVVILKQLGQMRERQQFYDELFDSLNQSSNTLKEHGVNLSEALLQAHSTLAQKWIDTKNNSVRTRSEIANFLSQEVMKLKNDVVKFEMKQHDYREKFRHSKIASMAPMQGYAELDKAQLEISVLENELDILNKDCVLFEVGLPDCKQLRTCRREVRLIKQLWDYSSVISNCIQEWKKTPWLKASIDSMDGDCKFFLKELRALDKESRQFDVFTNAENDVKNMITAFRAVSELQNPAVRERHWAALMATSGVRFAMNADTKLGDLLNLQLHKYEDEVKSIVDRATKEMSMEKTLRELNAAWADLNFDVDIHSRTQTKLIKMSEELVESLQENQMQLQGLMASKYVDFFREQVSSWQKRLASADQVYTIFQEVQKTWTYLETIFVGSEDIRKQLPQDTALFDKIDKEFKVVASDLSQDLNILRSTGKPGIYEKLESIQAGLGRCEQALSEYLETKRLAFPRFYFVSNTDLLDILSNGNSPEKVSRHLTKLFDSLASLTFEKHEAGYLVGVEMKAKDGEKVKLRTKCNCDGQVESWLMNVLNAMRETIKSYLAEAVTTYEERPREQWIFEYPAQVSLAGSQIWWTNDVNLAFGRLEEGMDTAMKDYHKKLQAQLGTLVSLLLNDLTLQQRQCIETIATIDVHNRDTVGKLVQSKVDNVMAFAWQAQLRHRWDSTAGREGCYANICDAQFAYDYEYLGNTPRLVVTPLTDRCYITLTQSLHLILGGAPAGPAGTGKTETTKDLGKALGCMVYVFNCSEQMDYKSVGNIYKGLSQTGAWGCFDEFNRISVEVLSVVAVQVKCIQDALKMRKKRFNFLGEDIVLRSTVGLFITMNPGYAGRAELPENLKALFRPCAMVVPDFELIAEINLVSQGFINAKLLARKFVTLYSLCKELLSKQAHYDWGLRAIKSVLVVAGKLKRMDKDRSEDQVLMRALRDFNIPKITTEDKPIFMGLIGDLFPALNVPPKKDKDLEAAVRQAALDLKLQPKDAFVLKVVQFQQLLDVRHSVFILGNAGTGKTQVWKTLHKANINNKKKPLVSDLNPKAVSNDELFGVINPSTREWKDGLFAVIMRDLFNAATDGPKWIVLDGDIDPMWIESLNTVMDDNKVLTLASNERIALTPNMRLVFEISHLKTATPATVSRAGILFINVDDIGWEPFVVSWRNTKENLEERKLLEQFFDRPVKRLLEVCKTRVRTTIPIPDISIIQTLCSLLDAMLPSTDQNTEINKEQYEVFFHFAAIWAFGGPLLQEQAVDHRVEFNAIWNEEFPGSKFCRTDCTVFDVFWDDKVKEIRPWTSAVTPFVLDPNLPLQAQLVQTTETVRVRYLINQLVRVGKPVMLVGPAGSGKSVLMAEALRRLPADDYAVTQIAFNFYTTSMMLQNIMEKPLEKKSGRSYGPVGNKKMIYFLDDLNMSEVDKYGTVQPHTIIKQHIDYGHWYDRQKLFAKDILNCQYLACMNPSAGSFTITPRLQRHFSVFSLGFPSTETVQTIFGSFASHHFQKFPDAVRNACNSIVQAALTLHGRVAASFLPTAVKFHYIFNLRDLSNIFQGLLFSKPDIIKTKDDLVKLWMHESLRVYHDKLIEKKDVDNFVKILGETTIKHKLMSEKDLSEYKFLPYSHFAQGLGDPKYAGVRSYAEVQKYLQTALNSYNEELPAMNLVMFQDAIDHICRISRILELPRANALLVGVGGSGKQSLSRLAAYLSGLSVVQITLRKGYGIADLKADLADVFRRCGVKNENIVFLLTDSQIPDETFLVVINDLLASGEIPDLFPADVIDEIINALRNEVKAQGLNDDNTGVWRYFLDRVRRNLKVILCFSPVGPTLRMRSRKFPAVTNCTSIDWFHEWPQEALISVSRTFLQNIEVLPVHLREPISQFMAFVHSTVNEMGVTFLQNERRHNYTTPKSFLEHIRLYSNLITAKSQELQSSMGRLENGLQKIRSTATQVDDMKAKLATKEKELAIKNEETNKLIEVAEREKAKVNKEKEAATKEEHEVAIVQAEVSKRQRDCEKDLAAAEPALRGALAALDTLDKNNLTEFKSFGSPPPACVDVAAAVMILLAPNGKVPKDRSWKACKVMMAKVDGFLDQLKTYNKENIHENCLKAVDPYLKKPEFDPANIESKSKAAAGLCAWVINIIKFYRVYCDVEPKRKLLATANAELADKTARLADVRSKVAKLEADRDKILAQLDAAETDRAKTMKETSDTSRIIELANRLMGGLKSENDRWGKQVQFFKKSEESLPGDVLLVSAFVSYLGSFTRKYRQILIEEKWKPFMKTTSPKIPTTPDIDFLSIVTDDAMIAKWNNDGLPSDRMSTENAVILTASERWPLMIDPQLQGIRWIKGMYGDDLKVIRLGQKGYLDKLEVSLAAGLPSIIENMEESVDPILDPLVARNTVKKGRAIKIGEKEVEYNSKFRLIMHTKLANPHYRPEMQAQAALINFTVTRSGLEDQLLAEVVRTERPDLEQIKSDLTKQQNDFKITLKRLEDELLRQLSAAEGNFLGNVQLVESLELNKRTAIEIEQKVEYARKTEQEINNARDKYRPAAARASLLYFIINEMNKINPIYQFSLEAFNVVFRRAIAKTPPAADEDARVKALIDSITYSVFIYTKRGLFERDKVTFTAQMAFQVLQQVKDMSPSELDFFLRLPSDPTAQTPVDFLSDSSWGTVKTLSMTEEFKNLDKDIEGSPKRWKKIVECDTPEREKLPQEWKGKSALQRMMIMRALRPDRMIYAVKAFVEEKFGERYVENRQMDFGKSFEESGPTTPIFFILSSGVDPLKDVEALGKKIGYTFENQKLHNVSLGQGQEPVADRALEIAAEHGHWVILQNIHLVKNWLPKLDKKLELLSENPHKDFRVFISAEPAPHPSAHIIPQGLLENSIKITNEPPTGMLANLHKALDYFNQDTLEQCSRETEFKSILFALCYFHAVVAERRKFGPQGWNRAYPFNAGDLIISSNVLFNYLENNVKVPWTDLRYLFGEIMYGGHITDDWDRRLCRAYLEEFLKPEMIDNDFYLAPGFKLPTPTDYKSYHNYIDESLPAESPYLYGLHPNAEIGFLTATSEALFRTVLEMQPRDSSDGGAAAGSREEKINAAVENVLSKLPPQFNIPELYAKASDDRSPYTVVSLQECERMNILMAEMKRSLQELKLGLKGELTISPAMDELSNALYLDTIPPAWVKFAYPSLRTLSSWVVDLTLRIKELEQWTTDFKVPCSVWLGGLFNPQSFLTAIMQVTARKNEWPLDRMTLQIEVTKKQKDECSYSSRDGSYIHGLYMEGARWDMQLGVVTDAKMKELFCPLPVIFVKAIPADKEDARAVYECPVYKIKTRGDTFVVAFKIKAKDKPTKWILAGVALLLEI